MAQNQTQTVRTTFNKGLLTEFSELNFPNEASVDELNCTLHLAGNRTKRLGVQVETGDTPTTETYAENTLVSTALWTNVGGDADLQYLVVQRGGTLRFYNKGSSPLSDGVVPVSDADSSAYILDMTTYARAGGLGASASAVEVASVNGALVVASPQINTFYIERDNDTGVFTVSQISFKVRDFEWVGDKSEYDTESATSSPSVARQYDTLNTGWTSSPLSTWVGSESSYPPLTHPWYSGKDASGVFSVTEWQKVYSGNTLIVNGHFILDLFNKDRDTESGLTGVTSESPSDRFNSVAAYSGRAFYGGIDSKIYFSQLLEEIDQLGDCYQQNDPTSEEFSDLLDTDGGYINIPEAAGIRKLHPFGPSLLVFASNGVWKISGVDDVFRATEFSVTKVTSYGLSIRRSFTAGSNGAPFWWSNSGIHTIIVDENGIYREVNISKNSIQTFWNNIESDSKVFCQAVYDGTNDRVAWFYPNNGETTSYKLNRALFFDVELQAFYPWKVSDLGDDSPYIVGVAYFEGAGKDQQVFNVVDSSGNLVIDSSGNQVVATLESGILRSSEVKLVIRNIDNTMSFGGFSDPSFLDWGGADYSAYAESAYNFIGDLGRKKNSPYITVLLRTTETGWSVNEDGTYSIVRPSSLKVSSYWDFSRTTSSTAQEAYRYKYPIVVDPTELTSFDYPTTVIATRLKTRGRGRVVRLRFEGSTGKDFNLLGWETLDAVNRSY